MIKSAFGRPKVTMVLLGGIESYCASARLLFMCTACFSRMWKARILIRTSAAACPPQISLLLDAQVAGIIDIVSLYSF